MLVLAIAAVIIVMSVRYYQSASASQRANACLSYLQAVVAEADSLSEATQSYSTLGLDVTASKQIDAIIPRNEAVCNFPGMNTVYFTQPQFISFYIKLPKQACRLMIPALRASGHWKWDISAAPIEEHHCDNYATGGTIYYFRTQL